MRMSIPLYDANEKSELTTYNTVYGFASSIIIYVTPSSQVYVSTTVPFNRPSDTAFMFSAWVIGTSVLEEDFTAYATIKYKNTSETKTRVTWRNTPAAWWDKREARSIRPIYVYNDKKGMMTFMTIS